MKILLVEERSIVGHDDVDIAFKYCFSHFFFQVINNGNWKILEEEIRDYAIRRNTDMKVISGTYGQLELIGKKINFPETDTPVPSHFWKVLHDENLKAAVAFVILNNPYYNLADANDLPIGNDKLCTSQCDFLPTGTNQKPSKGLVMCCSVDDLRAKVKYIPALTATELWNSGNDMASAFGERLKHRINNTNQMYLRNRFACNKLKTA